MDIQSVLKHMSQYWEVLQLTKDDSEHRMRWTFVQELLEHKWHIRQDYCGQMCDYELVPVDDFKNMQKKLKEHIGIRLLYVYCLIVTFVLAGIGILGQKIQWIKGRKK